MIQESETAEFERKRREAEEVSNAKTAKNRAKRQKKKERAKASKEAEKEIRPVSQVASLSDMPLKKRRLVNGTELVFKKPGEASEEESDGDDPLPLSQEFKKVATTIGDQAEERLSGDSTRITIVEEG